MSNLTLLYIGNDMVLEVDSLREDLAGAVLNDATVSVVLTDSAGVQAAGSSWPQTLAYVDASDGLYRTLLPYTLTLVAGRRYTATVSALSSDGIRATWVVDCVAAARSA